MAEWFRNTEWNENIEAEFAARLGRARDKAQYLNIQAYTLLATQPGIAADLCRRVLVLNNPAQAARAGLYLGTALAVEGDFDGAITALEGAIEAERREPMYRTGAHLDQALLVALARRSDMYDTVLGRLEDERAMPLRDQPLSALIAQALIANERDDVVGDYAAAALRDLDESTEIGADLPIYLSADLVKRRLAEIVNR